MNGTIKYSIQNELSAFINGSYNVNDINGDGIVDEDDFRIIQNNVPLNISVQNP